MKTFMILILRNGEVVRRFEAMARDACTCVFQHLCLLEDGEKMDVRPLAQWQAQQNDRRALEMQIDRPDELTRAMGADRA